MRRVAGTILIAGGLGGCAGSPPMTVDHRTEPQLRRIHGAFAEAVATAGEADGSTWHAGVVGNGLANVLGPSHRGLCHEWQVLVYEAVRPAAVREGWEAGGIALNMGTPFEHHAVLIYDPSDVADPPPLDIGPADPVYVLDGWRRGRADMFSLHDWLAIPRVGGTLAELEDLELLLD